MIDYKNSYRHINKDSIHTVRTILKDWNYYKKDQKGKLNSLNFLVSVFGEVYKIPSENLPTIEIIKNSSGFFSAWSNTIGLNEKLSLITFLHEFKHFMQFYFDKKNNEDIARGWSLSVFYRASPYHYNRAKRKGLIFHDKPFD